jgi:hypothetical protein
MLTLLVVDNDAAFLEKWARLLRLDHNVIPKSDVGSVSASKARGEGVDLALIDRRAQNDDDEDDESGAKLAMECEESGVPAILVTAFLPGTDVLFDHLRERRISGAVSKATPMGELAACIRVYERTHRVPNGIAAFRWKGDQNAVLDAKAWKELVVNLRGCRGSAALSGDDLAALFRALVPACATDVEIRKLTQGAGGAQLLRGRVSFGDGPVVEEVAIKFGSRAIIHDEELRYDRYVGPLPDGAAAQLRWRAEVGDLAALAYSWVGDSVEEGIPFGPDGGQTLVANWKVRLEAISRLFGRALNGWYDAYRRGAHSAKTAVSLFDYYTGDDGIFRDDAESQTAMSPPGTRGIRGVTQSGETWQFDGCAEVFHDPVAVLQHCAQRHQVKKWCVCHGDMHVRNVFVLPDGAPRLIDFGETNIGHVYRDFAALETSVLVSTLRQGGLRDALAVLREAYRILMLSEFVDYRSVGVANSEGGRALLAVLKIRRAAADAVGANGKVGGLTEYLCAIGFHYLKYGCGRADEIPGGMEAREKESVVLIGLLGAAITAKRIMEIRDSE